MACYGDVYHVTFVMSVNIFTLVFSPEMGMTPLEPDIPNSAVKGPAYRCADMGTLIEYAS